MLSHRVEGRLRRELRLVRPDILEFLHQAVRYSSGAGVDRYNILFDVDYLSLDLLRGHIIFVLDRDLLQLLQLDNSDAL